MNKNRVALLSGGVSAEREVSLKTGEEIYRALDKEKYEVLRYDPGEDLERFIDDGMAGKFQLIIPALHGPFGEDGRIQGVFEMMGVPYLFSDHLASALAMNKEICKSVAKDRGVPVIKGVKIDKEDKLRQENIDLPLPAVIKPVELGSSVGISIAKTPEELREGVADAFQYDDHILAEEYIKGRELTVTIMGREKGIPLPVIEIIPKTGEWFDYRAKYEAGAAEEVCPAEIPEEIKDKVQEYAVQVFEAIGCRDVARADFIWDEEKKTVFFLEVNTIPGMTATSLVPQAARAYGLEFPDFLDKLIEEASKKM